MDPYLGRLSGADGEIYVDSNRNLAATITNVTAPTTAADIGQQKIAPTPATMIPTTPTTESKRSELGLNSVHEKRPTAPAKMPRTSTSPANDGVFTSTEHRGSILGMEISRRKKKKKKLPRFRSDGRVNRPMQKIIQIHRERMTNYFSARTSLNGDDDDSSSDFSAKPRLSPDATVIVNSLSAWKQERYFGDGGVPNGGELNIYDIFQSSEEGGGQNNFDDSGQQLQFDGDEQNFHNDIRNFQGDGEFHGGNEQNFHDYDRNVYDGEINFDEGCFHDGDQKVFNDGNGNFHDDNKGYDKNFHDDGENFDGEGGYFHGGSNQSYNDGLQNFYKDEA